jgi:hypothetical protein
VRLPVRLLAVLAICLPIGLPDLTAAAQAVSWQEAIARLTYERSQVRTCVALLKKYGDAAARDRGAIAYADAKAEYDAVVSGLETALAQGQGPASLPDLEARLRRGFDRRTEFCDSVKALLPPAPSGASKGPIEEITKGAIGPLVDAVVTLWKEHRAVQQQTRDTIRIQLEDAVWPSFDSVSALP